MSDLLADLRAARDVLSAFAYAMQWAFFCAVSVLSVQYLGVWL